MKKQDIELILPANLDFSNLLRCLSREVFSKAGFMQEWVDRLTLVVDELFVNAYKYGSSRLNGKIYIVFSFNQSEIFFSIQDEGRGSKKITAKDLKNIIDQNHQKRQDVSKTNGRGLALISDLWTDEMRIKDSKHGGIYILIHKKVTTKTPKLPSF